MKLKDFFLVMYYLKNNVRMRDQYDIYFDVHSCEIKNLKRFQAECYICYLKLNKGCKISFEEFLFSVFWEDGNDVQSITLYNNRLISLLRDIENNEKLKSKMSCLRIRNNTLTIEEYFKDRLRHTELNFLYGYQLFKALRKYRKSELPEYLSEIVKKYNVTIEDKCFASYKHFQEGIFQTLKCLKLMWKELPLKTDSIRFKTNLAQWANFIYGPKFAPHISLDYGQDEFYLDCREFYKDTKEHWINNPKFETDYSIRSVVYTLLVGLNLFATVFLYFTWGGFFFSLRTGIWDNMMFAQNCIDALPFSFITIPLGAFYALWLFPTIMDYIIWPSPFSRVEEMEDLKNYDIDKTINEDKVIVKRNIAISFVWDLLDVTLFNKHRK